MVNLKLYNGGKTENVEDKPEFNELLIQSKSSQPERNFPNSELTTF